MGHRVAIFMDAICSRHETGPNHPERPERLTAALEAVKDVASLGAFEVLGAGGGASEDSIGLVHTLGYIAKLRLTRGRKVRLDADTVASECSYDAALAAAGCVIAAAETALGVGRNPGFARSFAIVRPPGHHAMPDRAMGFCLLNNIAIAARHVQRHHGARRVAIVDFDVHHGNGTQAIFEADPSVLFISSHQGGDFYPGTGLARETGTADGLGATLNFPVPAGSGDDVLTAFYSTIVPERVEAFAPQLILVSAGYDLHDRDPVGGLSVTDQGVSTIAHSLVALAERVCDGRIAFVLEGGYDLAALTAGIGASLMALAGADGSLSLAKRQNFAP